MSLINKAHRQLLDFYSNSLYHEYHSEHRVNLCWQTTAERLIESANLLKSDELLKI